MQQCQKYGNNSQLSTNRQISVVLSICQYRSLFDLMAATLFQTKAELVRHILNKRAVVAVYYGDSLDDLLKEIAAVEMELDIYSESIRRLARSLYTVQDPEVRLSYVETAVSIYQKVGDQIPVLYALVGRIAGKLSAAR